MNVSYADINTTDAAQMLGVTAQAVRAWCRNEDINYVDVAEAKSNAPRYLIPDDEVQRIMNLMKQYGKRGWIKHNTKPSKIIGARSEVIDEEKLRADVEKAFGPFEERNDDMEFTEEQLVGVKRPRDDSEEQILLTVAKIREFKEEENDLKGRLVQVQGEIDILEKELKDLIWKE